MDFARFLDEMILQKKLTRAVVAERSGMSEVYLYQVLSRKRNPTRSRVLCMCIGLSATIEETQTLLRSAGHAMLYARNRSDAVIMYGIMNGMDLFQINDLLFNENENTLI